MLGYGASLVLGRVLQQRLPSLVGEAYFRKVQSLDRALRPARLHARRVPSQPAGARLCDPGIFPGRAGLALFCRRRRWRNWSGGASMRSAAELDRGPERGIEQQFPALCRGAVLRSGSCTNCFAAPAAESVHDRPGAMPCRLISSRAAAASSAAMWSRRCARAARASASSISRRPTTSRRTSSSCRARSSMRDCLDAAMANVRHVYHLAGIAKLWSRDRADFDRINAGGTAMVLRAAAAHRVERVMHCSTEAILLPKRRGARRAHRRNRAAGAFRHAGPLYALEAEGRAGRARRRAGRA